MARVGVQRLRGNKKGYYVDGLTQAKKALAALPEAFREQAAKTIGEGSQIILSEAQQRAPVGDDPLKPGHIRLKPSLGREVRGDGLQAAVLDALKNKPFLGICLGLQAKHKPIRHDERKSR